MSRVLPLPVQPNELVLVECYLQNEGALVRFWYPVVYLERPPPGYRKSPTLSGIDAANMLVHQSVLVVYGCMGGGQYSIMCGWLRVGHIFS